MAAVATRLRSTFKKNALPPLENGDNLDQKTFHARYEATDPDFRAQLINGIVYVSGRVRANHGRMVADSIFWLSQYQEATPGLDAALHVTILLGASSEPEPDICLIVDPNLGGQTWINEGDYLCGAPELIWEVCDTPQAIELHAKKLDYERAGVCEYVVVVLRTKQVLWFTRQGRKFKELGRNADGVFRSQVYPGLWLHPTALLRDNRAKLQSVLHQGLNTAEHAAFVEKLRLAASGKR